MDQNSLNTQLLNDSFPQTLRVFETSQSSGHNIVGNLNNFNQTQATTLHSNGNYIGINTESNYSSEYYHYNQQQQQQQSNSLIIHPTVVTMSTQNLSNSISLQHSDALQRGARVKDYNFFYFI